MTYRKNYKTARTHELGKSYIFCVPACIGQREYRANSNATLAVPINGNLTQRCVKCRLSRFNQLPEQTFVRLLSLICPEFETPVLFPCSIDVWQCASCVGVCIRVRM